jgi:hypothetical protein
MYESEIIEPIESLVPTNLSRNEGHFQDNFQEYNSKPFHYAEKQELKKGYKILNSKLVQNKYNTNDFDKINVDGKNVYITNKLYGSVKSSFHDGQYTLVDVPYRDSNVNISQIDKIYGDDFNGYTTNYKNYNQIEGGDITYYVNRENAVPFISPLFSSDFNTTSVLYKDPMGGVRPVYIRQPNKPTNKLTERNTFEYGLSWVEDTNEHREDMMARNLQKINKNRWTPRWENN